ncbi:MAG TPA: YdeI/OmpD-associated family protein [Prosthecobacter sp.]|nr:YdeI/OmpD-associated family protein [Prosthecobacter sp.]
MDVSRPKTRDPEAWIAGAPDFSRSMAEQLREWILRWEPDLIESIKWNTLCFSGRKLVCAISACKKHLSIAFFRGTELAETCQLFDLSESNTSLQSIRLTTLQGFDLKAFRQLLHAAVALDARGDLPPPPALRREEWPMPAALAEGLKSNKAAAAFFDSLKPTYQREYKVWIGTAKQPQTIQRRLKETLNALASGRKWAQRKG